MCILYISVISTYFMSTQQLNIVTMILSLINVCITTNTVTELCSPDIFRTWSLKFQTYTGMLILRLKDEVLFLSPQTE